MPALLPPIHPSPKRCSSLEIAQNLFRSPVLTTRFGCFWTIPFSIPTLKPISFPSSSSQSHPQGASSYTHPSSSQPSSRKPLSSHIKRSTLTPSTIPCRVPFVHPPSSISLSRFKVYFANLSCVRALRRDGRGISSINQIGLQNQRDRPIFGRCGRRVVGMVNWDGYTLIEGEGGCTQRSLGREAWV